MHIEVSVEEAQFIINCIAQQHPLIKKIAEQMTTQQAQLANGELHGDIDPQRGAAGGAEAEGDPAGRNRGPGRTRAGA